MSERDSRSRSRSPLEDEDEDSRGRRNEKRKFESKPQRGIGRRNADCRVYVSNIPYEFKWQDLKDLFRTEVGNVAYVEMFNDDNGKPRGSAIVDFETADIAKEAIDKMHRYEAKGRKLVVKAREDIVNSRDFMFLFSKGMDRDRNRFGKDMDRGGSFNRGGGGGNNFQNNMLPSPMNYGNTYGLSISFLSSLGINGPLGKRVFVANLDYKVDDEDLRETFNVAGKVISAEVIKDSDGKSRGFGVIEYDHPIQAVQAISMLHNQEFYDRRINVRLDKVSDKKSRAGSTSKLPPGLKSLGMGLGAHGEAITDVADLSSLQGANANASSLGPVNSQMGMAGGFNMGGNNLSNNMRPGVSPSLPGMGMSGVDNMGMGGSNAGLGLGVPNVLNLATALSTMANASGFGNQGIGNGTGPMFNNNANAASNFGSNQSSANEYNSNFPNSNRCSVQISNLPLDYTWKNLKDLCRNYGDIKFAEIKSKGVGWVRFSSEAEARRTADMLDRQRFDGRVLNACIV